MLGKPHIYGTHHIHGDIALYLVLKEMHHLLEFIQPLVGLNRLELPVELPDLLEKLDLGDGGVFHHLGVIVPSSLKGIVPFLIDNVFRPSPLFAVVIGDVIDPLIAEFLEYNGINLPGLNLNLIEEASFRHFPCGRGDFPEVGRVEIEGILHQFDPPGIVDVSRQAHEDRIGIAVGTQGGGSERAAGGHPVVDAVCRLMGHDDMRFHRPEEVIHLILLLISSHAGLISHDIALRDSSRPHLRPAIATNPQIFYLIPVQMEILLVEAGVLKIHVIIPRQAKNPRILLHGYDIEQHLVLLLHHPAGPDGVLLVPRPFLLDLFRGVGAFQELVHEILDQHPFRSHSSPQSMEIVLEFMVTDGGLHAIERDVDQIAGNDIYIRHGLREQAFEFLEIAVDVGEIYEFHDLCIGRQGFSIK